MRKRVLFILLGAVVVAAIIVAVVLLRRSSPPTEVKLLPPADAYIFLDFATVRRAAVFSELPKVEFEADYEDFVRQTGINVERDLDVAAFALQRSTATDPQQPAWRNTGIFTGRFDRSKLDAYFRKAGATTETYRQTIIYDIPLPGRMVRVAILDDHTVAATNTDGPYVMQGMIDRHAQFSGNAPDLIHAHYKDLPFGALAWTIARPPVSTPGGNARLELPGGLGVYLPAETVIVASVRFLGSVELRAQAFAKSEDDARRVSDQLSAFLALFRVLQNSQAKGNDANVKAFFDSIQVTREGTRTDLSATVPTGFIRKLVASAPTNSESTESAQSPPAKPEPKAAAKSKAGKK